MASTISHDPFAVPTDAPPAPVRKSGPPAAELVGTTSHIAPRKLSTYHKNPRRGDTAIIAGSLKAHGMYKPICVNVGTKTGRPNEVLAGNHTLMAFRDLAEANPDDERWNAIWCAWVDVDEDTAARIVAMDNRASEVGTNDNDALLELLQGVKTLEGTGYDQDYIDMLVELTSGPPDLDALADEHGDPEPGDGHDVVRLALAPEVSRRWTAYRSNHADDTAALASLLDAAEAP